MSRTLEFYRRNTSEKLCSSTDTHPECEVIPFKSFQSTLQRWNSQRSFPFSATFQPYTIFFSYLVIDSGRSYWIFLITGEQFSNLQILWYLRITFQKSKEMILIHLELEFLSDQWGSNLENSVNKISSISKWFLRMVNPNWSEFFRKSRPWKFLRLKILISYTISRLVTSYSFDSVSYPWERRLISY